MQGRYGIVALAGLLLAAAVQAQPWISVEPGAVVVKGVTPGADVAWFSVARESVEYWKVRVVRREGRVADGDRDGTVQIKLEEEVPPASVWIAFDMTSGASAVGAPEGFDLRPIAGSMADLRHATAGLVDFDSYDHELIEVLLVRPGVGAWGLSAGDGGITDTDGRRDGGIAVVAAAMWAVGTSPQPPTSLQPGDVFAVIDTQSLQHSIGALPKGAK